MKKSILTLGTMMVAVLALSSCKKDYTCDCNKTYTNSDGTTTTTSDSKYTYTDNLKNAEKRCNANEKTGTDLSGSYTRNCDIK